MGGVPHPVVGEALQVGIVAPDFALIDNGLGTKTLADFGKKIKLISVVPSLDTGICDQQTRRFNEEIGKIPEAVAITVSVDLPFAQARWCGNAGLEDAITLSDYRDVAFGRDYGVLIADLRLLARAVFILNEENEITYIEYLDEIKKHPDYEAALAALRSLVNK
ncbi:MAG TPA: thiol peroxidase [Firmicutes bacterium]|jgi:thiol peroxidase|nr:MAG: peroxidase [Peptococcaceae bacterium 1109]HHT74117.1 thiol peroxidase [Bacillota bacterium]